MFSSLSTHTSCGFKKVFFSYTGGIKEEPS